MACAWFFSYWNAVVQLIGLGTSGYLEHPAPWYVEAFSITIAGN